LFLLIMGYVGPEFGLRVGDRKVLESWFRAPTTPQQMAKRAGVILASAEGESIRSMARRFDVSQMTVCQWRARFLTEGIAGLQTRHRSGRPRRLTTADEARIVAATMKPPKAMTHWSARSLAKHLGVSHMTVHRVWRKHGLQPHRIESFKFSTDPEFDRKMADVVGLYLNPPEKALVLCVDEKSQIQALDRTQPIFPMRPGLPARMTHDYVRHGTTSLFAALEVLSGKVTGRCFPRHTHREFLSFLKVLDRKYRGREIHLICDNYGTHKHPAVRQWLADHPRFHLHLTPTSASWLNLVERWFGRITQEAIRRGSFDSVRALERAILGYLDTWNGNPKPFVWTKTASQIRTSIRHAHQTSVTGH
jgi:transposase